MSSKVAERYAKAVLDLAKEQGKVEVVYKDMQYLINTLRLRDFAAVMASPIIKSANKIAIVKALLTDRIDILTLTFLNLVITKYRAGGLHEIAEAYIEQYNEIKGIVPVVLTTAIAADDSIIQEVKEVLKKKAGLNNIELSTLTDADLIGGYTVQYQNKLYDASVRRQLTSLGQSLTDRV